MRSVGFMLDDYEYFTRQDGQFAALALLSGAAMMILILTMQMTALYWFVLLPCLCICIGHLSVTILCGIRISDRELRIFEGTRERRYSLSDLAYLRVEEDQGKTLHTLKRRNGTEERLPERSLPDGFTLIREMTDRGVPVRHEQKS